MMATSAPRARGYIRDAKHKRTQIDARYLLGAAHAFRGDGALHASASLPDSASLEHFEAPIMDQGPTSACTGHGTAQALVVAFAATGDPLPWIPSPKGIYTGGRELGTIPSLALEDQGAMPADVMAAITKLGVRPMQPLIGRFSDCDPSTINARDTLSEIEAEIVRCIVGEYRIDETALDVVEQVCATIANACAPVGIGTFVDSAFEEYTSGAAPRVRPNQGDPRGGGHWLCITSYRTDPAFAGTYASGSAKRIFRGPNSWGEAWGDAGHFEATEDWLRASWDLYACTVRRAA